MEVDKLDTNIVQLLESLIGRLERIDALNERRIGFPGEARKEKKEKHFTDDSTWMCRRWSRQNNRRFFFSDVDKLSQVLEFDWY